MAEIFIVPELALIVGPPDIPPYDMSFRERIEDVFVTIHRVKKQALSSRLDTLRTREVDYTLRWAFSDALMLYMLDRFPYAYASKPGYEWVKELLEIIHDQMFEPDQPVDTREFQNVILNYPDIIPEYIDEDGRETWQNLLATCAGDSPFTSIASYPEQAHIQVAITWDGEQRPHKIDLLHDANDWDDLQREVDPWFQNNLPLAGEHPYHPPRHWHPNQPFPRDQRGYLDAAGWRWVWDREEMHWDVQDPNSRNYKRITPDGRILD